MTRPRTLGSLLLHWLGAAAAPLYVVDERRTIVYANAALGTWLGVDVEALRGVRCDYHAPPTADPPDLTALAAALCPPPTALAGQRQTGRLAVRTAGGTESRRWAEFWPMPAAAGDLQGVLVLVASTEVEESETADSAGGATAEQLHRQLQLARQTWWGQFLLTRLAGASTAMRRVREQARCAAETQARVVVIGPRGAGREFVARAIHRGSLPVPPPLITWDGTLLDGELLPRALEPLARPRGETSGPTTLLVKEVDALPAEVQRRLAELLIESRHPPRTLVTTRRSLLALARDGSFSSELASWLSTLEIELPPLRERSEDLPLLAQGFVEEWNGRGLRQFAGFVPEALDCLRRYGWPGEVAELSAVVSACCQRGEGPYLGLADLPATLLQATEVPRGARPVDEPLKLDEFLLDVEKELLRRAMRRARGNKAKAARLLGISRPRLLRRWSQLGLDG